MDVTSRKVGNIFVVFTAIICFGLSFYMQGWHGVYMSLASFAITFLILLPLYIFKVFGGGDYKFFVALSIVLSPLITTDIILLSIVWGALIGLLQTLFSGQARDLLYASYFRMKGLSTKSTSEFKIPYTVAYLLGWLTWYRHGGIL